MNKKKVICFLFLFLIVNFVQAFPEFSDEGIKNYDKAKEKIELRDNFNKKIADVTLIENTRYCSYYCYAILNVSKQKKKDYLFDSVNFYNKKQKKLTIREARINETSNQIKIEGWKEKEKSVDWIINLAGFELTEWAWWNGISVIYDEINDSYYNVSLWNNNSAVGENNDYFDINTVVSPGGTRKWINSSSLPNINQIQELQVKSYIEAKDGNTDASPTKSATAKIEIFGNILEQVSVSDTVTPTTNSKTTEWNITYNDSSGNYSVYNDGVFQEEITPINNEIYVDAYTASGSISSRARLYYVYYSEKDSIFLNSPEDYYNNSNPNITYNCSFETDGNSLIHNVSIWHNATGTWHRNKTIDLITTEPTSYEAIFNINFSTDNSFIWNCEGIDNESSVIFNDENKTIFDISKPNITKNSPASSVTNADITINFSISDEKGISYCYYNITRGASLEKVNTVLTSPYNNTHTLSGEATYSINIWCNDTSNVESFETYSLIYSVADISGGGGGGGGTIEIIEEEQLTCEIYNDPFNDAWEVLKEEQSIENLVNFWNAYWDKALCDSASSIVPIV